MYAGSFFLQEKLCFKTALALSSKVTELFGVACDYRKTRGLIQSTPDNSNLQGKSKKGSSYREFEENSRE